MCAACADRAAARAVGRQQRTAAGIVVATQDVPITTLLEPGHASDKAAGGGSGGDGDGGGGGDGGEGGLGMVVGATIGRARTDSPRGSEQCARGRGLIGSARLL